MRRFPSAYSFHRHQRHLVDPQDLVASQVQHQLQYSTAAPEQALKQIQDSYTVHLKDQCLECQVTWEDSEVAVMY